MSKANVSFSLRKQLVDMYIRLTWICSAFNVNDKLIIRQKLTGLNRKKISLKGYLQAKQQLQDHKRFLMDRNFLLLYKPDEKDTSRNVSRATSITISDCNLLLNDI